MPSIGSGTIPLAFGDFGSGFRIYDRVGMSMLRNPYTQATSGLTRFHARRRLGAQVTIQEAFRFLKCAAS
jgi:HK97 family phage major capsid protein